MVMHIDPIDSAGGGRATSINYGTAGINNPGFEDGDTGWVYDSKWQIQTANNDTAVYAGAYSANLRTSRGGPVTNLPIINSNKVAVSPGKVINARGRCYGGGRDGNVAAIILVWYDNTDTVISISTGNSSGYGSHRTWDISTLRATAPENTASVSIGFTGTSRTNGVVCVDNAEWDLIAAGENTVTLTSPVAGSVYAYEEPITLSVAITGTTPYAVRVEYYSDVDGQISQSTVAPFTASASGLSPGVHEISAVVVFSDDSDIITDPVTITVAEAPPEPDYVEYAASNAYSYLVLENIYGLASEIPPTAKVTGIEIQMQYTLEVLNRTKDKDVDDPAGSTRDTLFDIVQEGKVEAVLLKKTGETFVATGNPMYGQVILDRDMFEEGEVRGVSEDKYLSSYRPASPDTSVTSIGADPSYYSPDQSLFGLPPIPLSDFMNRSIGLRFVPTLSAKPDYADSGDAVVRFGFAAVAIRVYYDAGSAEYFFYNNSTGDLIQGSLAHYTVEQGNFVNGDASGYMQLLPELQGDGGGNPLCIGWDLEESAWSIHTSDQPDDSNRIGWVGFNDTNNTGMEYNSMPSQYDVITNYSRYEFISSNFYGDEHLATIYGVNGVGRAFAMNYDEGYVMFYNIQNFPFSEFYDFDPTTKDRPRHIANHHGHLALGFAEGRVDLSVIGKPYSFDGLLGASSWALGDNVTGLLPLSGTILGIFCGSSIHGLSGTTVDNFDRQVISPNMGAIEYTIVDMGFPVYTNTYGVYTLSQTQQYGDYMGTPMSQAVSPWLRPRLLRQNTYTTTGDNLDKQVVCAWPVRSKNQYRIGFADGAVMSMTINSGMQSAPTFSLQEYTVYTDDELDITTGVSLDSGQEPPDPGDGGGDGGGGGDPVQEWIDLLDPEAPWAESMVWDVLSAEGDSTTTLPATFENITDPRIRIWSSDIVTMITDVYPDAVISAIRGTATISTPDSVDEDVVFRLGESSGEATLVNIVDNGTTSLSNEQPWNEPTTWAVYLGEFSINGLNTYSEITFDVTSLEVFVEYTP